jgi:hypothetical protein
MQITQEDKTDKIRKAYRISTGRPLRFQSFKNKGTAKNIKTILKERGSVDGRRGLKVAQVRFQLRTSALLNLLFLKAVTTLVEKNGV